MATLRDATPDGDKIGRTTVFRRDGVLAHYTAFLRHTEWRSDAAVLVFFLDAESGASMAVDDLWLDIFRKAVTASQVAKP